MAEPKTQKEIASYLRKLDRLRWEFLRESDKYKADWKLFADAEDKWMLQQYEQFQGKGQYTRPPRPVICHKIETNISRMEEELDEDSPSPPVKMWLTYGMNVICNPELSYEESGRLWQQNKNDMMFYTNLDEFGISDKKFPDFAYSSDAPFIKVTINLSLRGSILMDELEKYITRRKKEFRDKKTGSRWILPKNVHFDTLEDVLKQYRMWKHEGQSYRNIARSLLSGRRGHPGAEDAQWSLVKKNIPYAKRIIKNVEQGIFP